MTAPWYRPIGDEVALFQKAAGLRLPVLLKGPTGCGKSRFVRHMAHILGRPLITVACQEDLSAADLAGRYLLEGGETVWFDGPVTTAAREGAICYLDEVVEARPDVLTLLHPLTDDRRVLPLERKGEEVQAADDFMVVVSYNPGYQSVARNLKESTRQRFVSIPFAYPAPEVEVEILIHESNCSEDIARQLVSLGRATRSLQGHGMREGASTRLLIYAALLVGQGFDLTAACEATIVQSLTDDPELIRALSDLTRSKIGG
jgi:nitric oxide reductase NorQ protein